MLLESHTPIRPSLAEAMARRILILDGAMGTMVQALGCQTENTDELNLSQPSLIGTILRQYAEVGADIITTNSFGCNALVQRRHHRSEDAPAMALAAARLARRAADAEYARRLAAGENRPVYVAGSIGPTGLSLTMATDAADPSRRESDFLSFKEAVKPQIAALIEGGVDVIQLETCFDALNTKAAICALEELDAQIPVIISATVSDKSGRMLTGQTLEAFYHSVRHCPNLLAFGLNCALGAEAMRPLVEEVARFSDLPLVFYPNAGIPDAMGRYNESPEEIAAVMRSLAQEGLLNIAGGCCGTTPAHIRALVEVLSDLAPRLVGYQTPDSVEGDAQSPSPSCPASTGHPVLTVSGLEAYRVDAAVSFTNVGERANVTGSRKFARLIASGDYEQALSVAAAQVAGGANIIDVNMDDAMLDSKACMRTFLRYVASDPNVAGAAIMIDSSHWDTLVEGLQNTPGRSIVNSISLKDGEEEFLRRARIIRSYGAVPIVMAFDEEGQAVTFERKIQIAERAYHLLTQQAGFRPCEIIFDLNVLSIGTGIPEHARFAIDFIEGVRWVKQNLPGALTSGGISNLSFAFRGNNAVREAMHSAFLYHAIKAGLDMAIVNPQMLQLYDEIEPNLLRAIEEVIFDRDEEATARLTEIASQLLQDAAAQTPDQVGGDASGSTPVMPGSTSVMPGSTPSCPAPTGHLIASERLQQAIIRGTNATLTEDTLAELERLGSAVAVVEGPLMEAMARVGERFAEGKMFLPQVVKSAKVMRQAVQVLEPYMGAAQETPDQVGGDVQNTVSASETPDQVGGDVRGSYPSCPAPTSVMPGPTGHPAAKPRFVIATIRGDVHDIGKNITSIVLQCGGFKVYDMGVMVPCEDILAKAREVKADIIGVSGLITPSLYRMEELCQMMAREGFTTPLFVGGAAASAIHTAVKLAPLYPDVHYGADASVTAVMAKKYLSDPAAFRAEEEVLHRRLRALHEQGRAASDVQGAVQQTPDPVGGDVQGSVGGDVQNTVMPGPTSSCPAPTGHLFADIPLRELSIEELRPHFDWRLFDIAYGIKNNGSAEAANLSTQARRQAETRLTDTHFAVRVNARFYPCYAEDDGICAADGSFAFPMLREARPQEPALPSSLADFFPPKASGQSAPLGLFAISVSAGETPDQVGGDVQNPVGGDVQNPVGGDVQNPVRGDVQNNDDLLLHALKAMLAEAASAWLQNTLEASLPAALANAHQLATASEPCKLILPGIGYACCPDHSLKREVLQRLDPDLGITLSESCAMLPVESICGFVIAARDARYPDIRHIAPASLADYARKRGFTPEEQSLFLGHLKQ